MSQSGPECRFQGSVLILDQPPPLLMDSFHLDTLLACITFWGSSRLVKNKTKGNIVRMNLGLLALCAFVWLRPPIATPAVWAAVAADILFILILIHTRDRDRPEPPTAGPGEN